MLCFRCEHRAFYLEQLQKGKHNAPRMECGLIDKCVCGCNMFRPVRPIIIKPHHGDNRPLLLNILSWRVERCEDAELTIKMESVKDGYLFYYVPDEQK